MEQIINKIIARNGEREVVKSSAEEMHNFIVENIRPEFYDPAVLCVKFTENICEDEESEDASSWFINPIYNYDDRADSFISAYGPKMAGSFLPEILLIDNGDDMNTILRKYNAFHKIALFDGEIIPEEEKFDRFMAMYDELE